MFIKSEANESDLYFDSKQNLTPQTSSEELCRICGNLHDGVHFSVPSCRACSAFYRRSVVETRVYICKDGNNECQLQNVEQRKICRACRLAKCIAEGMQSSAVQAHRDPLGAKYRKISEDTSSTSSNTYISSPHSSSSPQSPNGWSDDQIVEWKPSSPSMFLIPRPREKRSMLSRLSIGIENWELSQKYLHLLMYPDAGPGLRQIDFNELFRLDKATFGLVNSLIEDHFPLYGALSVGIKQAIIPKFFQMFRALERSVKNERLFGGPFQGRCYVQYGHYIDLTQLTEFFADEKQPEAAAKIVGSLFAKAVPFNQKVCELKLRDSEVAALSAVVLWTLVKEHTSNECFDAYRDRVFNELHEELLEEYGAKEAPTRQMELAYLLILLNMCFEQESKQLNCLICETMPHDNLHFNVLACRACSAFFRRNTVSGRLYKCKTNGQCRVEKGVFKFCKHCRYEKCIRLGMNKQLVQLYRDKIGPRSADQLSESPTSSNQVKSENNSFEYDEPICSSPFGKKTLQRRVSEPTQLLNKFSTLQFTTNLSDGNKSNVSILQEMRQGYLNYTQAQRELFSMLYSESDVTQVRYSKYVQMRRACLSPIYVMINDFFRPFNELDSDLKKAILRPFADQFTILDQAYQTFKMFYATGNTHIFLHYGQFIDPNNLSHFFDETENPDTKTKILSTALNRLQTLVSKMETLNIRDKEVSALTGILLWNEVSVSISQQQQNVVEIQEQIYQELHCDLESAYGKDDAGQRMGTLMCMLQDVDACVKPLTDIFTLTKLFNPNLIETD
ncbi:hypothetical protein M3Y97_00636200 [Aphelenchoides bicaudatus]|nr:hypothetical protein M3Y97_00636200 [Aphelenchoides bicaudatus]